VRDRPIRFKIFLIKFRKLIIK